MTRIWVRRGMAVAVACVLLVTVGSRPGYPQPPAPDPAIPLPPIAVNKFKLPPDIKPAPPAPVAKPIPTVDELIATLEDLKRQREELDKKEKSVAEQLKERLKAQQDRLSKLSVLGQPKQPAVVPDTPKVDFDLPPLPAASAPRR